MKRRINYVIRSEENERLIFRFYPRRSRVHGFHDDPPKNWDEVYKVYYSYSIIKQSKWGVGEQWRSIVMYAEDFDEGSCISQVSYVIKQIALKQFRKTRYNLIPFGQGTFFILTKLPRKRWELSMFQSCGKGYRFILEESEIVKFAEVIDNYTEYMLTHGEGI